MDIAFGVQRHVLQLVRIFYSIGENDNWYYSGIPLVGEGLLRSHDIMTRGDKLLGSAPSTRPSGSTEKYLTHNRKRRHIIRSSQSFPLKSKSRRV